MYGKFRLWFQRETIIRAVILTTGGIAISALIVLFLMIDSADSGFTNKIKSEKTESVLLISQQPEMLNADVFVNGVGVGKLLSAEDSEYSETGPHIVLQVKPGYYVFRVEKIGYRPFEQRYEIKRRYPEPEISMGEYIIFIELQTEF